MPPKKLQFYFVILLALFIFVIYQLCGYLFFTKQLEEAPFLNISSLSFLNISSLSPAVVDDSPYEPYRPDYNIYHNLVSFSKELKEIARVNGEIVHLSTIGYSVKKRPIELAILTDRVKRKKHKILITFGEHAREMVVVESFFDLIFNITRGYSEGCSSPFGLFLRLLLYETELHFVGLLNPDGKWELEQTENYCWRNNINGVDINRNTDWEFNGPGSSKDQGNEEYNGGSPWSEPETRIFRDLVKKNNYTAYFSIHSGERQVFIPFVDSQSKRIRRTRPSLNEELQFLEYVVNNSMEWFHDSGIAYEKNSYGADGCLFDWAAGVADVPYVLLAEIWGGPLDDDCFVQFNPSSENLAQDLSKIRLFYITAFQHLLSLRWNVNHVNEIEEHLPATLKDKICTPMKKKKSSPFEKKWKQFWITWAPFE